MRPPRLLPLVRASSSLLGPSVLLVGALLACRLLYLALWCPYSLVEDEANYWTWAQHLDWSYYTKGPGVAWTIWLTTQLFGNTEFGVRAAAPIFMAVGGLASAWLAFSIARRASAAVVACLTFSLAPAFIVLGIIHTIDSGFSALWLVAACLAWKGMRDAKIWALALSGFVLGLAVLLKYTALLMVPGLCAFVLLHRASLLDASHRTKTLAGLGIGAMLLCVACSPVAVWNAREGWPTIAHLLGHLGVAGGDVATTRSMTHGGFRYNPVWTLTLLATFVVLAGPASIVAASLFRRALHAGLVCRSLQDEGDTLRLGIWFCALLSVPVLLFYFCVSFFTSPEGNWSLAASLTLFPLAGVAYADARSRFASRASLLSSSTQHRRPGRTWQERTVTAHCIVGAVLLLLSLRVDLLAKAPGLSKLIPVGRLFGAPVVGEHANELTAQLRQQTKKEPFVIAAHYGRAAMLSFYAQPDLSIYCGSRFVGGPPTVWDFWPKARLTGDASLLGRPALLVGATREQWEAMFDVVEPVGMMRGDTKVARVAFLGYGFRGVPPPNVKDTP